MEEHNENIHVIENSQAEVKQFDWGTIVLTCKCGRKQTLMEHIQYGIQFILATNDTNNLTFTCDECGAQLKMHCEEGTPPVEEEKIIELVTDEETAQKIAENPNVEIIEETTITDENVPEENKEGESV